MAVAMGVFAAHAQTTIKLTDGTTMTGQPIAFKDQFVQVRLDSGGYTNISWARFSQETLQELMKNRTAAPFATIFLDPPPSSPVRSAARAKIQLKEVPRLDRPSGGNLFGSPVMLVLLLLVWAGSIYAGYEIAVYRQQPPALVCVVAGVLPVIGPALFLAMPTRQEPVPEAPLEQSEEVVQEEAASAVEDTPVEAQPAQPAVQQPVVYARGQFTFNRRFFETKFAGFMKMVPGEAERDKEIYVKSARGEYVGHRFSKVEPNEVYLQIKKGTATEDVMIPFNEIYEVQIRPQAS